MWLTPPHMNRKMTDFALGAKCGPGRTSCDLAGLGQQAAQGDAEEAAAGLREEAAPGDSGRKGRRLIRIHRHHRT